MFMHNMRHNLPANTPLKYWKKLNLLRHFQLTHKLFKFQIWQPLAWFGGLTAYTFGQELV